MPKGTRHIKGRAAIIALGLLGLALVASCSREGGADCSENDQCKSGVCTGAGTDENGRPTGVCEASPTDSARRCGDSPEGSYRCKDPNNILVCSEGKWVDSAQCNCFIDVPGERARAGSCEYLKDGIECSFGGKQCKVCRHREPCK